MHNKYAPCFRMLWTFIASSHIYSFKFFRKIILRKCYLWLWEHIQTPGANLAIRGDANQVVGVLGADYIYTIYRVLQGQRRWNFFCVEYKSDWARWCSQYRVCCCWQGGPLYWGPLVAPVVPQNNLSWVRASNNDVRVELRKWCWHNGRLQEWRACKITSHLIKLVGFVPFSSTKWRQIFQSTGSELLCFYGNNQENNLIFAVVVARNSIRWLSVKTWSWGENMAHTLWFDNRVTNWWKACWEYAETRTSSFVFTVPNEHSRILLMIQAAQLQQPSLHQSATRTCSCSGQFFSQKLF